MSEAEVSQFLCVLIKMGEALQNSGAEVFRVEDTLNRIAAAYGAEEVNIFVITSSIVVTLTMPGLPPQTQTRRLRKSTGNDLLELEQLNALSRRICAEKPPVEEFQQQLSTILAQPGEPRLHLAGSVLGAASFAVFFGGSLWDGVLAGGVAVFICWMERWLAPFCLNGVAFQFIASFLSGMAALLCCRVCPLLHADMVLIGVIYIIFRSMGKYLGAHFSAKAVGCDEKTVKYLGITLLPQAGVALGMCVSAQALGAADGLLVRNIVLFSVLIYELVGPLLTKEALTAAGEITAKPKEVLERRAKALAEAEPKEFLEEREAKKHKKQDL